MIDFLFKNIWIKILCVIIAGGLWVYAVSGENKTDFFPGKIPIDPKNISKNLAPVYDQDEVQVKVMASGSAWRELTPESFHAYVDLKNLSIGTHEAPVKITSSVPGVKIIEQNPEEVLVRIEPVATKKIQVGTKIEGDPAEGYEIGDPYIKPMIVEARGARSAIDDITRAIAIINLDGNAASLEEDIKLIALDLNERPMRFISFSPEFVKVSLPIIKETGGRILGIRANISGTPESGYWISKINLEPTSIVVVGDAEKLKSLDYLETKKIDVSGLAKSQEYSVGLQLPKGIEIAASEPKAVKVKIQVTSILSSREIIAGVSYVGLADGLKVTQLNPNVIKVIIAGMFNALDKLNSDNVVVNLNLSGKKAGSHRISIGSGDISTPPGTSVSSFVPSAVTVRIND